MKHVELSWEVYLNDFCEAVFAREFFARDLDYCKTARWRSDSKDLESLDIGQVLAHEADGKDHAAVLELTGGIALVDLSEGFVRLRLAVCEKDAVQFVEDFRRALPPIEIAEKQEVRLKFWRSNAQGAARSSSRTIEVPNWDEIGGNYPKATHEVLEPSFENFEPGKNGRLLLWHGAPGTGKTFAVRALAWHWREWCIFEYVVDPERLLKDSNYLVGVLTNEDEDEDDDMWRLLVLEDTGELLAMDAKEQTGQGLSRLLNLVDGLLGQGLRILVLVTTNEQLQSLHPAVSRPGRCAAEVRFDPFTASEAAEWMGQKGLSSSPGAKTLAEMFGEETSAPRPAPRVIGF